uniref:PAT complex subunit CCDC47 n=1 Tax=Rhodnius prolixus TaxID=13249 RepID=A0A4P6D7C5_RHOPR
MHYSLIKLIIIITILFNNSLATQNFPEESEDNEFAEFEDFEEDEGKVVIEEHTPTNDPNLSKQSDPDDNYEADMDGIVEDEENEFEHFQDEEEFEGFDSDRVGLGSKVDDKEAPKITITKVPLHFRSNWDSFYLEMLMISGLFVYFINFFTGKTKNSKMASIWYSTHKSMLEDNFSLVGDDGKMEIEHRGLIKESEHLYTLWCSGRTCCEGMLVELKFIKRQDLVAVIAQMMRPVVDQIHVKVDMSKDDMDSFVFCVANKKTAAKLGKDMADLSLFCGERKSGEKLSLPSQFSVMSEIGEVSLAMLDSKITAMLNRYADLIDYIHFSDQFSGPKQQEESNLTKLPSTKKVLLFGFNIPTKGRSAQEAIEMMKPLMSLVFIVWKKSKDTGLAKRGKIKQIKID